MTGVIAAAAKAHVPIASLEAVRAALCLKEWTPEQRKGLHIIEKYYHSLGSNEVGKQRRPQDVERLQPCSNQLDLSMWSPWLLQGEEDDGTPMEVEDEQQQQACLPPFGAGLRKAGRVVFDLQASREKKQKVRAVFDDGMDVAPSHSFIHSF